MERLDVRAQVFIDGDVRELRIGGFVDRERSQIVGESLFDEESSEPTVAREQLHASPARRTSTGDVVCGERLARELEVCVGILVRHLEDGAAIERRGACMIAALDRSRGLGEELRAVLRVRCALACTLGIPIPRLARSEGHDRNETSGAHHGLITAPQSREVPQ
jgi:hypothetical protein